MIMYIKKDSNGSGNIVTYRVTEASRSDNARHPIKTYVGVCSCLETITKHTVKEFPINPMQIKIDAAITTYVFAIVPRVVPMHYFTKINIWFFSFKLFVQCCYYW